MANLLSLLQDISPEKLRVAPKTERGRFPDEGSPYKPLMLLTVLSRVLDRHPSFRTSKIRFETTCELFVYMHTALCPTSTLNVNRETAVQPFWKLGAGTPKIWELVPNAGRDDFLATEMRKQAGHQLKSSNKLNENVQHAEFPESTWMLVSDPISCETMISFLLASYFRDVDSARGLRRRVRSALDLAGRIDSSTQQVAG